VSITAFKGFDRNLQCRGFQYEEGKTYEHDGPVAVCVSGFHAVTQPIDVLRYYPPATSIYHQVELDEVVEENDGDSKVAARVIKIGARIELPALIKAQIEFVFAHAKKPGKNGVSDEENGLARSTKTNGAATASGDYGAATASGDSGAATASGDSGAATASGYYGAATASGYSGAATASGYSGAATASGRSGRARGSIGSALFLAERDADWKIINVAAVIIDGDTVKADTFYTLRDGQVVEA
jgi:hypothetical protein